MVSVELIRERIVTGLTDADVEVEDLTGSGDHFRVAVTSQAFHGRSTVEQHRLVYQALGDAMQSAIHALSIKTRVPHS